MSVGCECCLVLLLVSMYFSGVLGGEANRCPASVQKQCDESSTESFSLMDQAQLGVSAGHAAAAIVGFKLTERLAVTETQLGNLQVMSPHHIMGSQPTSQSTSASNPLSLPHTSSNTYTLLPQYTWARL